MSNVLRFPAAHGQAESATTPTFKTFHSEVTRNDRTAAANTLCALLAIDPELAERATKFYAEAIKADTEHVLAAMSLYGQIRSNEQNESLLTLQRVFGLSMAESIPIYAHLKTIFGR